MLPFHSASVHICLSGLPGHFLEKETLKWKRRKKIRRGGKTRRERKRRRKEGRRRKEKMSIQVEQRKGAAELNNQSIHGSIIII